MKIKIVIFLILITSVAAYCSAQSDDSPSSSAGNANNGYSNEKNGGYNDGSNNGYDLINTENNGSQGELNEENNEENNDESSNGNDGPAAGGQ